MKIETVVFKDAVRIGNDQFGSAVNTKFDIELDLDNRLISVRPKGKGKFTKVPLENVKYFTDEEDKQGREKSPTSRAS